MPAYALTYTETHLPAVGGLIKRILAFITLEALCVRCVMTMAVGVPCQSESPLRIKHLTALLKIRPGWLFPQGYSSPLLRLKNEDEAEAPKMGRLF